MRRLSVESLTRFKRLHSTRRQRLCRRPGAAKRSSPDLCVDVFLERFRSRQACKGCTANKKCMCTAEKGLPGEVGLPGLRGSQGIPGDIGAEGPPGPPGFAGDSGSKGGMGDKGHRVSAF